jgi:excisionase family DNA binding protein
MRAHPKNQVDPVLVSKTEAARLLSVSDETIDRLIRQGDLPTKVVGIESMIPYRSLLVFAGVARWTFKEIVEA